MVGEGLTENQLSNEPTGAAANRTRQGVSRRAALASLVGIGGLRLFGTEPAYAQGLPSRRWGQVVDVDGNRRLGVGAVVGQQQTVITACTTITEPGVYVLGTDLVDTTADQPTGRPNATACISIRSSDVVFEGNGHTIDGTGISDWAVHVTAQSNVTVKNLDVREWARGVELFQCSNSAVQDCTATSTAFGILLSEGASANLLENNVTTASTRWGITVEGSDNRIAGNTAAENAFFGIQVLGRGGQRVTGNLLTDNTIRDNGEDSPFNDGILTFRADDNRFTENFVTGNAGNGIELVDSSRNIVTGNTVCDNGEGAIVATGDSTDNVIHGNTTECQG